MRDTFKKIVLWSSIRGFAIHFNICSLIYIKNNAIHVQLTIHGQCNVISRSCEWNKIEEENEFLASDVICCASSSNFKWHSTFLKKFQGSAANLSQSRKPIINLQGQL